VARGPVLAICGKGGVGKTATCALLARVLREAGVTPLLLVDGDPVGGLVGAIGERVEQTLAGVKAGVIAAARGADARARDQLARELDYHLLAALTERDGYALLALGRGEGPGCFCPANALLREALDVLLPSYAAVLLDAEAGVEQIQRQVTRRVSTVLAVTDGSARGAATVRQIATLVDGPEVAVALNRCAPQAAAALPAELAPRAAIPEDATLAEFDRTGRSLWELPADTPALTAARELAAALGLLTGEEAGA